MLSSPANRPLIALRWLLYTLLVLAGLVFPFFQSEGAQVNYLKTLWAAGSVAVFLTLYTLTPLPAGRRLTFQRLGLMIGETALAVVLVAIYGGNRGAFAVFLVLPPLLISLEHHWKYGLVSGGAVSAYLLYSGNPDSVTLSTCVLALGLPVTGAAVLHSELLKNGMHGDEDYNKLEKAYDIARRETTKRQEHEQELYRERRRFEGLVAVAQGLAQEMEEESLLARIVEVACDQLSARAALVLLLKEGRLVARADSGLTYPMVDALQKACDCELLERVSDGGLPLTYGCNSPHEEDRNNQELLTRFGRFISPQGPRSAAEIKIEQMVGVPLSTAQDSQAFGLLLVMNNNLGQAFTSAEARYLQVLSTNAAIALKNILFTAQLERSHWELIQALAQAIEAKDSYTSNHVGRVRDLSVEIARTIGLDREKTRVIAIAATLHDVGKISTPDRVLLKPGPLTDDEYDIMKQHAPNGAQILRGIQSLPAGVEPMVRHHHERWDGRGYPDGKVGKEIPLGAQIISIADCYDAMTYDRPYRKGFPKQEALKKMEMGCGTQFNPKLLCAFFAIQGYVPMTEPTAIDTYHAIVGKLKLGTRSGSSGEDAMVNTPHSTGSSGQKTEQKPKPLLLERN